MESRVSKICGSRLNAWTVDDLAVAEQLIARGVDYITSNILVKLSL